MNFLDIILIILSSAGLLHGITFAVYLSFVKKKKTLSNHLLSLILVFMSFRIGKSIMLNFGSELEPIFIFVGLAFLLLVGPLLKFYVRAMTMVDYKLPKYFYLELLPFGLVFLASFRVSKNWFESDSKQVLILFACVLIFIYLHFIVNILIAIRSFKRIQKEHRDELKTKAQKSILTWIKMLLIGSVFIWVSFVLNIIENTVPYIVGPLVYSIVIYFLSLKAFQLKITDVDGSVFKSNEGKQVFDQISELIVKEKLYLNPDISLPHLSKLIKKSTQKTSEVINQYAKKNFNDFINYYRIQEAKEKLLDGKSSNYTISSIAFDTGFNSLSSFNTAFKKFEGSTPSAFRKSASIKVDT